MSAVVRRIPFAGDLLSRLALLGIAILVAVSVFGPLIPALDNGQKIGGPRLAPPSSEYPFGTDSLGRSVLPRVVEGMRTTFALSVAAVLVATVIATLLGIAAAYRGGWLDSVIERLVDVMLSFPGLLLAVLLSAVIGPGSTAISAAIVFFTIPLIVRVVRGASLTVSERDFITASEVSGASSLRTMVVHILPNVAGVVVVQATYAASVAMLIEGALSFLGFGVQPPGASLGSLVHEGSNVLTVHPSLVLIPGGVLALAILCTNLVGDGLRDRLDPRAARELR